MPTLETMQNVVELLKAQGIAAAVEYPGYISIGTWAFGCEGSDVWCGNNMDGSDAVQFKAEAESTDAQAIAAELIEFWTKRKSIEERIEKAVEDGGIAFWAVVAKLFPEVTTGDFPPEAEFRLDHELEDAVRLWLRWNLPNEGCGSNDKTSPTVDR